MNKHFIQKMPDQLVPPHLRAEAIDIEFHWVSEAGPGTPSKLTSGISLVPTDSFETCPPLDIVLMGAHDIAYTPNEAELAFVRKSHETCTAFLAICGGVQVPLQAGLLQGRTATGPRMMLDMLRHEAPTTKWLEKRWVHDGKIWTTGALLNGTDMMHAFASEYWGRGDEESLASHVLQLGAWPSRDIDYKDVAWKI